MESFECAVVFCFCFAFVFVVLCKDAKSVLDASRPTAANLVWATNRMNYILNECIPSLTRCTSDTSAIVSTMVSILLKEANCLCDEDIACNVSIGEYGNQLMAKNCNIMTHCNAGSLATVCGGTALGVIFKCFYDNKKYKVVLCENFE